MATRYRQRHYIRPRGKIKARGQSREHFHPQFFLTALLVTLSLLGACAVAPRLVSVVAPSEPSITLTDAGLRLTVLPNTWSAYPWELPRYYTPVEVRIENARGDDVQIRYEDFLALDDGHRQYRAVPPAEVARAMSGGLDPGGPTRGPRPILLAGPWYPYRPWYWGSYYGPYYGPYGPWWYPDPYYYPYAWPRSTAQDVLTLGLREGPLLSGASVQGFLYLQQATARGSVLTVSWTPRLASGAPLATLSAQFRIVR